MASSWSSSCCRFCCATEAGHRKWQRRRPGGELASEVARSEFGLIGPTDIGAAGQRDDREEEEEEEAIFHDKNRKSSSKRKEPIEESLLMAPLLLLVLSLTRSWLPGLAPGLAPDVAAIMISPAEGSRRKSRSRSRSGRRKRRRRREVGDNRISCWPQQLKQLADNHRPVGAVQTGKKEEQEETSPNINLIEFNYHNNKLAANDSAQIVAYSCCLSPCDSGSLCDCRSVIIRHTLLRLQRPNCRLYCCLIFSSSRFRVGGISGGPGDIITWPNSAGSLVKTTISLVPRRGTFTAMGRVAAPAASGKEASSRLELIAPVCRLQLNLPARSQPDKQPIIRRMRLQQRVFSLVVAILWLVLNVGQRKIKPNARMRKREEPLINQRPEGVGQTNRLVVIKVSDSNVNNDNDHANDVNHSVREPSPRPRAQKHHQQQQQLICIDHPEQGRALMSNPVACSLSAVDESSCQLECNSSKELEANLFSFLWGLANVNGDDDDDDDDKQRPVDAERSLNNTNNGLAHYCYHYHHCYYYDYDYYHHSNCMLENRRQFGTRCDNNNNNNADDDQESSNDMAADMVHCVVRALGRLAASRIRVGGHIEPLLVANERTGRNELITDRENNYTDTVAVEVAAGVEAIHSDEMGSSTLCLDPLVGVAELLGFQGKQVAPTRRETRQVLSGPRRPQLAACPCLCIVLLLLCKLCSLMAASTSWPSSSRPSIMEGDDGSARPAASWMAARQPPARWECCGGGLQRRRRGPPTWATDGGPLWSAFAFATVNSGHGGHFFSLLSSSRPANKTQNDHDDDELETASAAGWRLLDKITTAAEGQIERIESLSHWAPAQRRPSPFEKTTPASREQSPECTSITGGCRLRRAQLAGSHSGHGHAPKTLRAAKEPIDAKDRWRHGAGDAYYSRRRRRRRSVIDIRALGVQNRGRKSFVARHHHHHHYGDQQQLQNQQRDQQLQKQQQCPSRCQCVWKNGKQFADCSQLALSDVPAGLDPLLQVLNMSSNPMQHLAGNAFNSLNLNNLQRIFLTSCQLEWIHEAAFENLKLVVELDFSWNRLQFVPLAQIGRMSLLRKLSMRGNPLKSLTEATFVGLNSTADRADNLLADQESTSSTSLAQSSTINMGRLYESYPILARSLLSLQKRPFSPITSVTEKDDSFVIEQMELELLESIVRQHEDISSGDSDDDDDNDDDDDGRNDDDIGNSLDGDNGDGKTDDGSREQDLVLSSANELNQSRRSSAPAARAKPRRPNTGLGGHFSQLQELDFGQCQLTYIKWSVFDQLDQLKRLHLDGNQLSQLSGKLVETLPRGLHQLSLEENPLICDCRSLALKRWLQSTRTPLSAPVRCAHFPASHSDGARKLSNSINFQWDGDSVAPGRATNTGPEDDDELRQSSKLDPGGQALVYLDRLQVEEFVCPPQANSCFAQTGNNSSNKSLPVTRPNLATILAYLEPTLINGSGSTFARNSSSSSSSSSNNNKPTSSATKLVEANEGDRVEIACSYLAHPDWSLRVIWLADFSPPTSQARQIQPSSPSFPTLLYDSRFDTQENSTAGSGSGDKQQGQKRAAPRIRFEQSNPSGHNWTSSKPIASSRSQTQRPDGLANLETRLTIESASLTDAARYKCLVANRAGLTSLEVSVRVNAIPAKLSVATESSDTDSGANIIKVGPANSIGRDQRSWQDQVNKLRAEQSIQMASSSSSLSQVAAAVKQQQQQQPQASNNAWLRSSTTFQVTIVIVSVLMAAVIIAFILFCIIIYQIKPSATSTMVDYLASPSSTQLGPKQFFTGGTTSHPLAANRSLIINAGGSIYAGTPVGCATTPLLAAAVSDPITGQTPVHFIAHPIFHQQAQFPGPTRRAIDNHAILATTELSQQEQESIQMVNNWNTAQTTATTTITTVSPRNSYSPNSSSHQSADNWPPDHPPVIKQTRERTNIDNQSAPFA